MNAMTQTLSKTTPIQALMQHYSVEVTAKDHKGMDAAGELLAPGSEVFVANLPNESAATLVSACATIARKGLAPVPHMVARNIHSRQELDETLARLNGEAGVDRALVIGGDRDHPVGPYDAAIQTLQTGLYEQHGVRRVYIGVHPEGHPRVADEILWPALAPKLAAAQAAGLEVSLISQFAFDAAPYLTLARRLRADGITAPLRVGVAGPAQRSTLIKYALMCGVGASLRALKERQDLAQAVMAGETPEGLLRQLADAQAAEPDLGIDSVHFFTFGALTKSVSFAEGLKAG
jgi:methylenetetrahydrofolate reductase (NADPH)